MSNKVKYLSYEGLSHYTDKLKEYFASKEHTHTRFTSDLVHFEGAIHICNISEYEDESVESGPITGIYFSDGVEDMINNNAYAFIREEGDDVLRVHSNYEVKLSTGGAAEGNNTDGINGPNIRIVDTGDYYDEPEYTEKTIQLNANNGVYVNGSEVATKEDIPTIIPNAPANVKQVERIIDKPGWFRIGKFTGFGSYVIGISGSYSNGNSTAASFTFNKSWAVANISQTGKASITTMVSKIRIVKDANDTSGKTMYIDVYNQYAPETGAQPMAYIIYPVLEGLFYGHAGTQQYEVYEIPVYVENETAYQELNILTSADAHIAENAYNADKLGNKTPDEFALTSDSFIMGRNKIDNLTATQITTYADLSTSTVGHSDFKLLNSGSYKVQRSGSSDLLINLRTNENYSSASALEFLANYNHTSRLKVRKIIDNNRVSGEFKELAWYSDIPTIPTALKNPNALTIQGNGTTLTNGVYDGSSAKTVNITPDIIGAATATHTHSEYAGKDHTHSYLPLSGGTLTGALTVTAGKQIYSNEIYPTTTAWSAIGSANKPYYAVYSKNIYQDGVNILNIYQKSAANNYFMTTNPFDNNGKLYINSISDALYCASHRYNVTIVGSNGDDLSNNAGVIFDGNYETKLTLAPNTTYTITIDAGQGKTLDGGYHQGYLYISFYHNYTNVESISGRVYTYNSQHFGTQWWSLNDGVIQSGNFGAQNLRYSLELRGTSESGNASVISSAVQKIEITIKTTSAGNTYLTTIEQQITRPDVTKLPFVSKYGPNILYHNLTAPQFIENGTSLVNKYAAKDHTHTFLAGSGKQQSATTRNLTNFPATMTLFAGGWNTSSGNYATGFGTTLDISHSTWYQRLAFNTTGRIEYFRGINTDNTDKTAATLSKIGDLAYTSDIPTSLKNPNSLTIQVNGTTLTNGVYDGSSAKTVNITAASLGLSTALKYCGVSITELTDGATTKQITLSGNVSHTATTGCVVIYNNDEFAFDGSKWNLLGPVVDICTNDDIDTIISDAAELLGAGLSW